MQFGWILFAVKFNEKSEKQPNSIWISLILIQEYMQYEEYMQFGLISMGKYIWVICACGF